MRTLPTRRDVMAALTWAGAVSVMGPQAVLADERPPETTTVRLSRNAIICFAPEYVAEELLRAEGFTDVRYPLVPEDAFERMIGRGEIDFGAHFVGQIVHLLDTGLPITAVGPIHAGCYELFAHEPVHTISDLKGRRVGIPALTSATHLYLAIMAAHIGLDPDKDIEWVAASSLNPMELFAEGKVDAFLGFPPEPQELRARKVGRVILNTATDKPWSQYFCCLLVGNREFVRSHPVATKRVLRALLKAADSCAAEPEQAARRLVDGRFAERYDYALQTLKEVPYDRWRDYDPEDTMRFFALRLHDVGMIRSSPNTLLAEGTDWRFFNELKRELKA